MKNLGLIMKRGCLRNSALGIAMAAGCVSGAAPDLEITFRDLHPNGAMFSEAYGVDATRQVGLATYSSGQHAILWSGSSSSFVDLNPLGAQFSMAVAIGGSRQAGSTGKPAAWSGTANSVVYLNPNSYYGNVYGIYSTQYVGNVQIGAPSRMHAALWRGTTGPLVDLHPATARDSIARAVNATEQAGNAVFAVPAGSTNYYSRAAMWTGSAASFRTLHPAGATDSVIYGITATQQAGTAVIGGAAHAALWSGSSNSFVDLHPAGASESQAMCISGQWQGGCAVFGGVGHAALWAGSASSYKDLGEALGSAYNGCSVWGIYSTGATIYVVGIAAPASGSSHAMLWIIRQQPPPLALVGAERVGGTTVTTLTWTNNGVPCSPQSSVNVTGRWSTVSTPRVTNGNWIVASVTNAAAAQFYRLRGD